MSNTKLINNLNKACESGDLQKVISSTTKIFGTDLLHGFYTSCTHNHLHIVMYFITKFIEQCPYYGFNIFDFLSNALDLVLGFSYRDIINYIMETIISTSPSKTKLYKCLNKHLERLVNFKPKYAHRYNEYIARNEHNIFLMLHNGADNLHCLSRTNNFKLYNLYCKYRHIDTRINHKYLKLLRKHPIYVLLVAGYTKYDNTKQCWVKMLPVDIVRLMFEYI